MSSIKIIINGVIYYKEFNIPNAKQTVFQPFPQWTLSLSQPTWKFEKSTKFTN
jgi:hypothetical protein